MGTNIVEIQYVKEGGKLSLGRYTYLTTISLQVGDMVVCPTSRGSINGRVFAVDVPESKVDERIMPMLKTITEQAADTEADHE
ncbi:hypothetical protein [Oscillibacter sp.]|uniref:hypothetical protein n=1 Tax=Oscillibacter sp. TaxID=1945593 RepID=UPI00339488BF